MKSIHQPDRNMSIPAHCCIAACVAVLVCTCLSQPDAAAAHTVGDALELIEDDRTASSGVRLLRQLMNSRDDWEAVNARVQLSRYYRTHNRPRMAVQLFSGIRKYDKQSLEAPGCMAYFEYVVCLATEGQTRDAAKMLRFATENTEGKERALALAGKGDLLLVADTPGDAIRHYNAALAYGNKYYRPRRISSTAGVKRVPGADRWKKLAADITRRRNDAQRGWDIQRYGQDFIYYRLARTHDLKGNTDKAIRYYELLIEMYDGGVFAEAARYYKECCRLRTDDKRIAVRNLNRFVQRKPMGLYRGSALRTLGEHALNHDVDVRAARKYFSDLLRWVKQARQHDQGIDLYVVPEKAMSISAPPASARKMDKRTLRLVTNQITPNMVINRKTTPWLLNRLEEQACRRLGFLEYIDDNHKQALQYFIRAHNVSPASREQCEKGMGSLHRRHWAMCVVKYMFAYPAELKQFRGDNRIRLLLADFHGVQADWKRAEGMYKKMLEPDFHLNDAQRACIRRCLAEVRFVQGKWEEAIDMYAKLVEEGGDHPTMQAALLWQGKNNRNSFEERLRYCERAYEMDKNSYLGGRALFYQGINYYFNGDLEEAETTFKQFLARYPDHSHVKITRDFIQEIHEAKEKKL